MGWWLVVAALLAACLPTFQGLKLRESALSKIEVASSYDVRDVTDATLLFLVDYHEDVLQPSPKHLRPLGFNSKSYAALAQKSHQAHRRLCELLGLRFFPHEAGTGSWRDDQGYRGRVIATREANVPNSCRFHLDAEVIPKTKLYMNGKNRTLVSKLDTYSRLALRDLFPKECFDDGDKPVLMSDRCTLKDLSDVEMPWTSTMPFRQIQDDKLPPLQGETKGQAWLGDLPSAHTLLQLLHKAEYDPNHPKNEGFGAKGRVHLGGEHGIPHPRVVQAVRGRNPKVRSVSPFGLVEKGDKITSYSSTYEYSDNAGRSAGRAEILGQTLDNAMEQCQRLQSYKAAYRAMEKCQSFTGCPFSGGNNVNDCCRRERQRWLSETLAMTPAYDGAQSLMETYLTHICSFSHIRPLKMYFAGVGIPAVAMAAHDALVLANRVGVDVRVFILEDILVDYELVDTSDMERSPRVGDWAREWWSEWFGRCSKHGPLCKLGNTALRYAPQICLDPPCTPKVTKKDKRGEGGPMSLAADMMGKMGQIGGMVSSML